MTALQAFLDSTAGTALIAMVGVAFADFLTGSFAALRDGTFALDALGAFLRKHIWGRVAPIGTLLALGYFGGGTVGQLFLASAVAASAAYAAEAASSIVGNLNPPKPSEEVATAKEASALVTNPVPTE
jgi:hypothetical protein